MSSYYYVFAIDNFLALGLPRVLRLSSIAFCTAASDRTRVANHLLCH